MATFPEKGEKGGEEGTAKEVEMGNDYSTHTEDSLETTDLSWDGISHLKMQNTPSVKPHKHSLMLTSHPSTADFVDRSGEIQFLLLQECYYYKLMLTSLDGEYFYKA